MLIVRCSGCDQQLTTHTTYDTYEAALAALRDRNLVPDERGNVYCSDSCKQHQRHTSQRRTY
ncbi:MAG: hypothetical protein GEV00_20030 [Actinophytocola sp.]|nr:hypothetical protein [Actinophytocola sp.]